jgi:type I site-specific restriction endonuclease
MSTGPYESEHRTRLNRVDPLLRSQGWTIRDYDDHLEQSSCISHAVTEYPTDNGPADYGLFVHGRFLGIVEAKKLSGWVTTQGDPAVPCVQSCAAFLGKTFHSTRVRAA